MSASCIQNVGDYIYVSYHTNGKASKGGLEVLHFEGNQIKPDQEVQGTTGLDINHLLVDNNRVYVAGGEVNKGAIFAYVPLQNNILTTGDDAMKTYVLNATEHNKLDANSITNMVTISLWLQQEVLRISTVTSTTFGLRIQK